MPELPEVETMRRGIAAAAGTVIGEIVRPPSRLRPIEISPPLAQFRRRAMGRTIERVGRLGKRVVLVLDSCDRIVIEPRMTGLVLAADPPERKHLRLVIELEPVANVRRCVERSRPTVVRCARKFKLSTTLTLSGNGFAQRTTTVTLPCSTHPTTQAGRQHHGKSSFGTSAGWASCGSFRPRIRPDLWPGEDRAGCARILPRTTSRRLRRSRRAIKVALLDQKAVAGVGNLYASEILHRAGVHPAKPCSRLRPNSGSGFTPKCSACCRKRSNIKARRSATAPIASPATRRAIFSSAIAFISVTGRPVLPASEAQIVRIVQAQRSTFYCPKCQRK